MRKLFLTSLTVGVLLFTITSCQQTAGNNTQAPENAQSDTANYSTIHWIDSLKDFGTVAKGAKVNIDYQFENTGDKPLFITSVRPTCGCTVADYTKTAVLPGEKGSVTAEFDSNHGAVGNIRKSIIVSSNTKNNTNFVLAFTGTVTQ